MSALPDISRRIGYSNYGRPGCSKDTPGESCSTTSVCNVFVYLFLGMLNMGEFIKPPGAGPGFAQSPESCTYTHLP